MSSKSLCAYPWAGAAIRPDGLILPCCKFDHSREYGNINDQDPRNSAKWNELREAMLEGRTVPNCLSCYKAEQSGQESLRQQSLKFFHPTDSKTIKLQQLEVSFNNLCNLACVMCSEEFSTRWQTEKAKHRGLTSVGVTENKFDYLNWDLNDVKQLKIIGGEPMMSQDRFISLLERMDRSNLSVMVATNATVLPNNKLKSLLKDCRSVSFKVSLDAVGLVNDWIRWPSSFIEIDKNINILEQWWADSENFNLEFHTVIGVYNIFFLEQLIHYVRSRKAWKHSFNWIRHPEWQSLAVLPDKENIINELSKLAEQYGYLDNNPFTVSIDRLQDQSLYSWNDFKFENQRLEKERNISSPLSRFL